MTETRTVAVIGLGLIGGSLARDLAAAGWRVLGFDSDAGALEAARHDGVLDVALDASMKGIADTDVVVVATPIPALMSTLEAIAGRVGGEALVMDTGSTKRSALEAAHAVGLADQFVGSHPMAGSHLGGWSAARTGMFRGATVYLCRTPSTRIELFVRANELWSLTGAIPREIDATEHDTRVAFTSHVPHATAAALARAMSRAGLSHADLGPGGRDALRLAASSPTLWTGIMLDNAEAMLAALEAFGVQIEELRAALRRGDDKAIHRFLQRARDWAAQ
jgi:prephenate dehydrogenase